MKKINLLVAVCAVGLTAGSIVSCGGSTDDSNLPVVRVGLHANLGAGAGYSAYNRGFFTDEGVKVEVTVGAGPSLATQVVNGDLDVSFMGGGVAWYYFAKDTPKIKMAALDNLTDDDRLIATTTGKGANLTINSTLNEIGNALRGANVLVDLSTTPKEFLTKVIDGANATFTDDKKLWWSDGTTQYPAGLSSYAADNEVKVENGSNANVAASMVGGKYDFCIAFAPVSSTLEKDTAKYKTVCKTSTHFSDNYTPSTWAVNSKWLSNNEATFKKFMKGLVRGMNFRHDNPTGTTQDIETVTAGQTTAESMATDIAVWLNADQQLELNSTGKMKKYAENIRQGKLSNESVDANVTIEQATCFDYLIEACNAVKAENK